MTAPLRSRALGSIALLCLLAAPTAPTTAAPLPEPTDAPLLVIGASYADGRPPFNDALQAPFGGLAVGAGSYLSVGDALLSQGMFVINEAQAGATTFGQDFCAPDVCLPFGWQSYATQLRKAAARVAIPNPADPTQILGYNARYVLVSTANDCLHSGAAGVPQLESAPCSAAEVDAFVDRMIDVGEDAMDLDLVPIYTRYPDYDRVDLATFQATTGLLWVVDKAGWNALSDTLESRVADELPGAIFVDAWRGFEVSADGIHPTPKTSRRAARRIRRAIEDYEECR